jgi:hypothetical protein
LSLPGDGGDFWLKKGEKGVAQKFFFTCAKKK